jgi:hypothetical protein
VHFHSTASNEFLLFFVIKDMNASETGSIFEKIGVRDSATFNFGLVAVSVLSYFFFAPKVPEKCTDSFQIAKIILFQSLIRFL